MTKEGLSETALTEESKKKKKVNGYNLIDDSKSVFLFTPKSKALGRVKIIKRENKNIELLKTT